MLNKRASVVLVLALMAFVLIVSKARAAEPSLPAGYTCNDVRENVKRYGYWPAILWARANGFKPEEIEAAKRCLARK